MKLIIREHINTIAEVEKRVYTVEVDAINNYNKIPASIGLMKGDIIVFRGAGDPVRLPSGSLAGRVLTTDPTSTTGLVWASGGGGAGATTTLNNGTASTLSAGTIVHPTLDQNGVEREAIKAMRYTPGRLYITSEDCPAGEDVECYGIPGTIAQVLVSGSIDIGDPIVVADSGGVGEALPGGTPTVGYCLETKSSSSVGLVKALLVENKCIQAKNGDSSSIVAGTVMTTVSASNTVITVKACPQGKRPVGVQANKQTVSGAHLLMHTNPGEEVNVIADTSEIVKGDWLVPSATAGQVRNGSGYGIGYALTSKASGSTGYVLTKLMPMIHCTSPRCWWIVTGITDADVIAAWQFVDMASESAALKSIHNGTEYTLSKTGVSVTWNASTGFYIPATNAAGLQQSTISGSPGGIYSAVFAFTGANNNSSDLAIGGVSPVYGRNLTVRGVGSGQTTYYANGVSINRTAGSNTFKKGSRYESAVLGGNWGSVATDTKIYINGAKQTLTNADGNMSSNSIWSTGGVIIQPSGGTVGSFYVKAVVLYGTQLTDAQHQELYENINAL